ncbi:hypothetical protein STEG23_030822, partial [Scotinomys teguina]
KDAAIKTTKQLLKGKQKMAACFRVPGEKLPPLLILGVGCVCLLAMTPITQTLAFGHSQSFSGTNIHIITEIQAQLPHRAVWAFHTLLFIWLWLALETVHSQDLYLGRKNSSEYIWKFLQ